MRNEPIALPKLSPSALPIHHRQTLICAAIACIVASALYGAYAGIEYAQELHHDVVSLRNDNAQAMSMLSGAVYKVDGEQDSRRMEEVNLDKRWRGEL